MGMTHPLLNNLLCFLGSGLQKIQTEIFFFLPFLFSLSLLNPWKDAAMVFFQVMSSPKIVGVKIDNLKSCLITRVPI